MNKKYESIFDNLSDLEFEEVLNKCGFKFEKVEGKGGLFINNEQITSSDLKEEYDNLILNNTNNEQLYTKEVEVETIGLIQEFDLCSYDLVA